MSTSEIHQTRKHKKIFVNETRCCDAELVWLPQHRHLASPFCPSKSFSSSEFERKIFPSVNFTRNDALELQKSTHKKGENFRIIKYQAQELRRILMCARNKRSETQKDVERVKYEIYSKRRRTDESSGENYIHKSSKNRRKSKSEIPFLGDFSPLPYADDCLPARVLSRRAALGKCSHNTST